LVIGKRLLPITSNPDNHLLLKSLRVRASHRLCVVPNDKSGTGLDITEIVLLAFFGAFSPYRVTSNE